MDKFFARTEVELSKLIPRSSDVSNPRIHGAFMQIIPPVLFNSTSSGTEIICKLHVNGLEVFINASGGLFIPAFSDGEELSDIRQQMIDAFNIVCAALSMFHSISRHPVCAKVLELGTMCENHVGVTGSGGNKWSHVAAFYLPDLQKRK